MVETITELIIVIAILGGAYVEVVLGYMIYHKMKEIKTKRSHKNRR